MNLNLFEHIKSNKTFSIFALAILLLWGVGEWNGYRVWNIFNSDKPETVHDGAYGSQHK